MFSIYRGQEVKGLQSLELWTPVQPRAPSRAVCNGFCLQSVCLCLGISVFDAQRLWELQWGLPPTLGLPQAPYVCGGPSFKPSLWATAAPFLLWPSSAEGWRRKEMGKSTLCSLSPDNGLSIPSHPNFRLNIFSRSNLHDRKSHLFSV